MEKDQLLSVDEICDLALLRFKQSVSKGTIASALLRGQIEGAVKVSTDKSKRPVTTANGGRWHAPAWAVLVYLANYSPRGKG